MKTTNSQFSILNFPLMMVLLLTATGCNHSPRNNDNPPVETAVVADSLFVPTGNTKLDSLLQLAAVAPQDTNLAKLYNQIAEMYEENDFEKAKEYYLKLRTLSEQLDWSRGRYWYAIGTSPLLTREGLIDSSIVIYRQAHELAMKENDEEQIAMIAINTATIYKAKEWYETALEYYMKGLSYFEPRNNTRVLVYIYYHLCELYSDIEAVEKAIEYGEKAYALKREDPYVLSSLGKAYAVAYQYETAKGYFEKALAICELQNNIYVMKGIYLVLGTIALDDFDLEKVKTCALQAIEIQHKIGTGNISYGTYLLGKIEQIKGNYAQSEVYIKEALKDAEEFNLPKEKRRCYLILSELAVIQRRYREHLQYLVEWDKLDKVIAQEATLRSAAEMEAKYETAKKELEIANQRNTIARQTTQRWILTAGVAVCLLILALLWYMLRLRTRRNLALAEMNATKDKFFNIISHDLKNPVVAQRDALRTLVVNSRSWDADRLEEYHKDLLKTSEEQTELVYNLLGWAQFQTGRLSYTPGVFSLSSRLRSDIALLRNMAEYKGITFVANLPDDALVTGDANMLSTVVRNLLTNAIKFTGEGGTVTLDVSPISPISPNYTISVSDTGTGMNAEQVQNLFRLDRTSSKRGTAGEQGTGLGLIVCKEFLEKHGSVLHVESEEGKGSRFWFAVFA